MSDKVRSAKGEMVDFDLIRIKSQISTPPSALVQEREKIIDRKLKRKIKKVEAPIPKNKKDNIPVVQDVPVEEKSKKQKAKHIENNREDDLNELTTD